MPRETGRKNIASNRKARHDYFIDDTYEAGISLMGTEVKALRMGRASLVDGFAHIDRGEMWLEGVHIPEYVQGTWTNHTPRRKRKLLLHREEIGKLKRALDQKGLTLVPTRLYQKGRVFKVELALARGKKLHDKRRAEAEKTVRRELREL